jgi:CDP-diacylglycerol---glycerol-3-phosphate 3-phosphatidyltransferase
MGIYNIKPGFQRVLRIIELPLVRWGINPDVLTIAALVFSVLGGFALFTSRWTAFTLLGVPFFALLRICLNALDGMVAKDLGLARPWGEVLNELFDRLADVTFFVGLSLIPDTNIALVVSAIVLMLLSSYIGILSKAAGASRQFGGVMGKADRMLLLSVASILVLVFPNLHMFNWFLVVVIIGLVVTILQRLQKTYIVLKHNR